MLSDTPQKAEAAPGWSLVLGLHASRTEAEGQPGAGIPLQRQRTGTGVI